MAQPKSLISIELTGPFFVGDPVKTYRQNIRALQDRIAAVGQTEVRARLLPGSSADAIRSRIIGRTSSREGRRWATYAVVSLDLSGLDRPAAQKAMAQFSGRHKAITRGGRNIGTTRGAEGRKAVSGATRAMRAILKDADMLRGL